MTETVIRNNLPSESLSSNSYQSSWDFRGIGPLLVSVLSEGEAPEKHPSLSDAPTYYYRVEGPSGTITNVPNKGADFFRQHRFYQTFRTLPDGGWELLEESESCARNGTQYPAMEDRYSQRYFLNNVLYAEPEVQVTLTPTENGVEAVEGIPTAPLTSQQEEAAYQAWLAENQRPVMTITYAFDDGALASMDTFWQQCRYYFLGQFGIIGGILLVGLISLLWLLAVCGRRPADKELHLLFVDRLWTEVSLCALFGFFMTAIGSLAFCLQTIDGLWNDTSRGIDPAILHICATGITLSAVGFLVFLLSDIRLLKARRFIKNSLFWKICCWCLTPFKKLWGLLRSCFDLQAFREYSLTKALQKRQMVFFGVLGGFCLLTLLFAAAAGVGGLVFLLLVMMVGLGVVAYWQMDGNKRTYEEINKGFNQSFEEQMKAERTKTALITNVSHDLKTPLTSIITYTDLLAQEELPDTARDYVIILSQKADRLKSMVADLFDLAKSAGGNIPLTLEVLDLKRLMEQTVADMADHIEASGLTLKTKLPPQEVFIYSDGKKLYRVFQNLIGNTLKYSMADSRVFITMEVAEKQVTVSIKNTSATEMQFTAEEILQRFNRGDAARAGDGNGLGLSIAESFTVACGGTFKLELDGDLFKVTVVFPLTDLPPTVTSE